MKVDIKNGTDATWTLSDKNWRAGSWSFPKTVRGISCCSDLGDLCSKWELIITENCAAEFQKSSASLTCFDRDYTLDGESCIIGAYCENLSRIRQRTLIVVHFTEIKNVSNCDGRLRLGSC